MWDATCRDTLAKSLLIARSPDGAQQLDCLMKTFSDLGVPIAEEKLEGPGTVVTFLGI